MKLLRIALLSAAAAALLSATDASAQVTFTVSANVKTNCVVDSATDMAITTSPNGWDPTTNDNPTATGTITVKCTRGTLYTVDVNSGVYTDVLKHETDATAVLPFKFLADGCASPFVPVKVTAANRSGEQTKLCAAIDLADSTLNPIAGNYSKVVTVDLTF